MASSKFTNYDHCCIHCILTKATCHVFFLVLLIIGAYLTSLTMCSCQNSKWKWARFWMNSDIYHCINRYLEVLVLCNQVGELYIFFDVEVTKVPFLDRSSSGFWPQGYWWRLWWQLSGKSSFHAHFSFYFLRPTVILPPWTPFLHPLCFIFILLPLVFTDATLHPQGQRNPNQIRKRGIQIQCIKIQ